MIYFVQQCQPIGNNSILPANQIFYTQNRPRDFDIDCGKFLNLIDGLNPHKAHDHGGISMQMLKLHNLTITEPVSIIYKNCLQLGVFPDSNIIPVHKKNSKQINNY